MGRYSPLEVRYKRVVLKLSGEALAGNQGSGIDYDVVLEICKNIKTIIFQKILKFLLTNFK